jgi:hypothetical protein
LLPHLAGFDGFLSRSDVGLYDFAATILINPDDLVNTLVLYYIQSYRLHIILLLIAYAIGKGMSMQWTKEMKEILMSKSEIQDLSYAEIAKQMSEQFGVEFTKNACIGMSRRLGAARRPSPIIKSIIKNMHQPVTIYELGSGMCKWPLGKPYDRPPFMYCGKPTENLRPWCNHHHKRVFTRSTYGSAMTYRA